MWAPVPPSYTAAFRVARIVRLIREHFFRWHMASRREATWTKYMVLGGLRYVFDFNSFVNFSPTITKIINCSSVRSPLVTEKMAHITHLLKVHAANQDRATNGR